MVWGRVHAHVNWLVSIKAIKTPSEIEIVQEDFYGLSANFLTLLKLPQTSQKSRNFTLNPQKSWFKKVVVIKLNRQKTYHKISMLV